MQATGWDPVRGRWVMAPTGYPYPHRQPPRPTYREPHRIQAGGVWLGILVTLFWFLTFAMVAWSARSYAWATIIAAVLALAAAMALNRFGDRGAAVGVAVTSALGLGVAGLIVEIRYLGDDWLLW